MPVTTLRFGILLSRRSLILNSQRREIKWVFIGAVFFLATLGQTAGYGHHVNFSIFAANTDGKLDLAHNAYPDYRSYASTGHRDRSHK